MAKILSATNSGWRKVIKVCTNPDAPQWVHPDGSTAPNTHTGFEHQVAGDVTLCQDCRYNWKVREFIWTGDTELKKVVDGVLVNKTDDDLANEVAAALAAASTTTTNIASLVNRVI